MQKLPHACCDSCPLKDPKHTCVPPRRNVNPRFIIVQDYPGKREAAELEPAVGPAGVLLNNALQNAGLSREEAFITNAIACYCEHDMSASTWNKVRKACLPRLQAELGTIQAGRPILACGKHALASLVNRPLSPMEWMGYPLNDNVFPLFNPMFALRESRFQHTFRAMIRRFARWVKGGRLSVFPQFILEDGAAAQEALNKFACKPIAIDVENAGDPLFEKLLVIGISDGEQSVSVPFPCLPETTAAIQRLFNDTRTLKVFHNAQHDMLCLEANGLPVAGEIFDTMVAHAALLPLLPHRLSFVAAQLTDYPRWKAEFHDEGEYKGLALFLNSDPLHLRAYNSKDAFITARIYFSLERALAQDKHAAKIYEELLLLSKICIGMRRRGVLVDEAARLRHREALTAEIKDWREKFEAFHKAQGLSTKIKLGTAGGSPSLKEQFFKVYGYKPLKFSRKTGQPSLNSWVLEQYRAKGGPGGELANIVLRFRRCTKLKQTYIDLNSEGAKKGLPILRDGRVHPAWSPWRVPAGRWGCSDPNLMNVPKSSRKRNLRDMFIASPEHVLLAADLDKAELRAVAHVTNDEPLLAAFEKGTDVHTANAKDIFGGIPEDKKEASAQRDFGKRFVYGADYLGQAKTLWESLVVEFPATTLMLVTEKLLRWKRAHPAIFAWHNWWPKKCFEQGYAEVPCGVGRRAPVYRGDEEERRFVINLEPQGIVAQIVNNATIELSETLGEDGEIVIQCHDELVLDVPIGRELAAAKKLKDAMTRHLLVDGRDFFIPSDVKIGPNWGNMKAFKHE